MSHAKPCTKTPGCLYGNEHLSPCRTEADDPAYRRGFAAGVEASLRAVKASAWTRGGVVDAIRALSAKEKP